MSDKVENVFALPETEELEKDTGFFSKTWVWVLIISFILILLVLVAALGYKKGIKNIKNIKSKNK